MSLAIRCWVAENGLCLHPEKTQVGDCRQPGEGFEFLGYRFEAGQRWVRKKSLTRFKDSIRAKTKRTRGDSLARIVNDLNPMLRGWFGYEPVLLVLGYVVLVPVAILAG